MFLSFENSAAFSAGKIHSLESVVFPAIVSAIIDII